ncbi:outer membrane beta-barrel protein [Rhodoplanes sp. TEM]|uniref:Outer membrane beta-barrel protein n=1 Tax=Rhodoplanes tepidamans TaxID=200616 RepID=A0ABT5JKY8_RHOTP|nr:MULTISPECIES: outer membrane beta-barrel protein [Rhodoplanes]MDC7789605.1 outer membrane beta-barrel protein [Rhodoplanes tepidamans]MDC7987748.1 outer membrane beta-barrel protein [Rhodoplanes sp. TEM]MDQ0354020.1 outer membrane immunogenic protein [Rhodoplanes tepidamans]
MKAKLLSSALVSSAALLALSGAASAADLAYKARPMAPPVPAFSWTGCYIGAHVGGASMNSSFADFEGGGYFGNNDNGVGAVAGGQLGCNYQMGMFVLGLEGEGYWSGVKQTFDYGYIGGLYSTETKNKYNFDVAARIGVAFDRVLAYGKIGWVWGQFDFTSTYSSGGFTSSYSGDTMLNGLLLGLGVEYALTNNWTVKAEYNYLNFGSDSMDLTYCSPGGCLSGYTFSGSADMHVGKIGINYKFGG